MTSIWLPLFRSWSPFSISEFHVSCRCSPLPQYRERKTAKCCYSLSFPGSARIDWTKVRLTTNHCACDERVRPARCLCRCWGSEWGGVETTPQRPKILKPPPNHPPQNKPPTATKRLPLFARTDFQSRILNPSSCFEPEHFSRNLPADRPSATHARRPPRQHTTRMGANLPACLPGLPYQNPTARAVGLLSSSPRSCTTNAAVVLPEPYRFLAAILVSMDTSKPP